MKHYADLSNPKMLDTAVIEPIQRLFQSVPQCVVYASNSVTSAPNIHYDQVNQAALLKKNSSGFYHNQLILAPFVYNMHWVCAVVTPQTGKFFIFDPGTTDGRNCGTRLVNFLKETLKPLLIKNLKKGAPLTQGVMEACEQHDDTKSNRKPPLTHQAEIKGFFNIPLNASKSPSNVKAPNPNKTPISNVAKIAPAAELNVSPSAMTAGSVMNDHSIEQLGMTVDPKAPWAIVFQLDLALFNLGLAFQEQGKYPTDKTTLEAFTRAQKTVENTYFSLKLSLEQKEAVHKRMIDSRLSKSAEPILNVIKNEIETAQKQVQTKINQSTLFATTNGLKSGQTDISTTQDCYKTPIPV